MGGYALALLAAGAFGTADFLGGLASRRAGVVVVTTVSQAAGFIVVLPVLLLEPAVPERASLAWGAAGGLSGCIGLLLFFRALARGVMSLAAPVTAVVAAALPVAAGVLLGERPAMQAWLGVASGLAAVAVISSSGRASLRPGEWRSLGLAVAAGAGFGVFFVCLSRTSPGSGLWPLAAARMSSLILLLIAAAAGGAAWRAEPAALRMAVVSGVLDMTANALFLLAVRQGVLALVAVLVSLYPAATVVLALAVLRERLQAAQLAGIAMALLAVGLIASS